MKGIILYLAETKKYRTSTKQITKNNYDICFLSGDLKTTVHCNNKTLDLGHKPFFLLWHWDVDNLGIWSSRLLAEGGFELLTPQFPPSYCWDYKCERCIQQAFSFGTYSAVCETAYNTLNILTFFHLCTISIPV